MTIGIQVSNSRPQSLFDEKKSLPVKPWRTTLLRIANGIPCLRLFILATALTCAMVSSAEEITAEQAGIAVSNWIERASGMVFGRVRKVSSLVDEETGAKMYVVKLEGGGYVVTTSDNRVSPVVAYSDTGDFSNDPDNPLIQILKQDAAGIQRELEKVPSQAMRSSGTQANAASVGSQFGENESEAEFAAARAEWADLLGEDNSKCDSGGVIAVSMAESKLSAYSSVASIEVDVSKLLHTKWGQTTHNGRSDGLLCYNYCTPKVEDVHWWGVEDSELIETNNSSRVPCGCVATAAAQLMYKWHHPGRFSYSKMKTNPKTQLGKGKKDSDAVRHAIGELTYEVGKVCDANWGKQATGMSTKVMVGKLKSHFGYESSSFVDISSSDLDSSGDNLSYFDSLVVPNLIAGYPCILSIRKGFMGLGGGHCVVIDGLQMRGNRCRYQLNFGWNGGFNSDWYEPPSIREYTSVSGVGVNIMPHNSGAIIAGVVVDSESLPVSGAKVTAGGKEDITDSHGRFSFVVSSGTYLVSATKDTLVNTATVTVKYSTGNSMKNAFVPIVLTAKTRTSAPVVSHEFDSNGQAVISIKADSGALITYSTDGSTPTEDTSESKTYRGPFTLNCPSLLVIRARAFKEGFAGSYVTAYRVQVPVSSGAGKFSMPKCVTTSVGSIMLDNSSAVKEPGEPTHSAVGNSGGSSVWTSFVPPADGDYTFTANGTSSLSYSKGETDGEDLLLDTQLAVYTGNNLSSLSLVAANDDVDAGEFDFSSRVAFHAVKGRTYRIAVDTLYGAKGTVRLEWNEGREDVASPVDYDVFYDGEAKVRSVQIRSTADWFVVDCSDWIELVKETGHDGESVQFKTPALPADSYRIGTILVQAGDGSFSTIKITQSPAKWYTDKDEAFEAAQSLGKRVFMVCGRDKCSNTTYVRLTACESDLAKPMLASEYVLWYCDCDNQVADYSDYRYGLGNYTLPLICIINPENRDKYVARRTGLTTAAELAEFLSGNSEGTLPSIPPGVSASNSVSGVLLSWGKARRVQTYEVWRGAKWNPDVAERIGEMLPETEFLDATAEQGRLYYYRVRAVNAIGAGEFSRAVAGCVKNNDGDDASSAIGVALGAPHLIWTTGGTYPWTVQADSAFKGASVMQSALTDPRQSGVTSILKTTVTGPTRMSFRYKTRMFSSLFAVTIDGIEAYSVTDDIPEWTLAMVEIPDGSHEIEFSYTKIGCYTTGFNGAYLDDVQFDVISASPSLVPATTDNEKTALTFTGGMSVSIDAPAWSIVYYTLDGTEPTLASPRYAGPFTVSKSTRVKAMCVQDGYDCSIVVSGLYLERHSVQAGEWTTDVAGAKKAALRNGSIIITLMGNYETCEYTRSFAAVSESAEFLSWARQNGVYLITADSARAVDTEDANSRFYALYSAFNQAVWLGTPALVIAYAWDPDKPIGFATAISGQKIGSVQYDGTVAALESGLKSFFTNRPGTNYVWIEFNGNGGIPSEKLKIGIAGQAVGELPYASRSYHYFEGWYTSAAGGVKIARNAVLNGNAVYYAHWTPYSYYVKFNAEGGSGTMANETFSYGMTKALSANSFTKAGYSFAGWATRSGGAKVYDNCQVVSNLSKTDYSAVNLYAVWVANGFTVVYDANGGSGEMSNEVFAGNETRELYANTFTRNGFAFIGWARSPNGGKVFDNKQVVSNLGETAGATVRLYAVWLDLNQVDFSSAISVPADYDGDGKSDVGLFGAGGQWFILGSSTGWRIESFGSDNCIPVPADYDGDGCDDLSVYDTVTGDWFIRYSTGLNGQSWKVDNFGANTCIPLPADYDGDGIADLSVYDQQSGDWWIRYSSGGWKQDNFGSNKCIPVPADYDGDGIADLSVYDQQSGDWWIRYSSGGWKQDNFGASSCYPVPADHDGDGLCDLAVYDQRTGDWFVRYSTGIDGMTWTKDNFGTLTCNPIPLDYDGDGRDDFAVYDTATRTFWLRFSGGGWDSVLF